jgi:hypothetical protein
LAYELKTKENEASVDDFISTVEPEARRADCGTIRSMMEKATGEPGVMWGASIVGFGKYSYKYASGHSGEFLVVGFSPRKTNFSIYIMPGFERYSDLLARLGKHKIGKSCLYVKSLADIDEDVLMELITESVKVMREMNTE